MSGVIRLDKKAGTSNRTVKQLLSDELSEWEEWEDSPPNKAIILYLSDSGGNYTVRWSQAGMKMSECISLCEIGKDRFKEEMGY
jgi:hypothetical protein